VTINTDNRLLTDTTVTKELHLCHRHYGWSLQTIKEIIIAGFKSAFMPYREKADLLAEISRELAKVVDPRPARAAVVEGAPGGPAETPAQGTVQASLAGVIVTS
jgi:adenosine deaminase